jgi:hypothetical protein
MAVNAKIPLINEQSFGTPPQQYSADWFSRFSGQLMRRLSLLSGPYDPQRQMLLQSPDDRVWKVTVTNSGNLFVELVDVRIDATRKERPPI